MSIRKLNKDRVELLNTLYQEQHELNRQLHVLITQHGPSAHAIPTLHHRLDEVEDHIYVLEQQEVVHV